MNASPEHTPSTPIRFGIVGAWSRRAEPTLELARSFDASAYDSLDAMLANIDVLSLYIAMIAMMQDSHPEYALRASAARVPVMCEQPAAVNARALQRMIDAARRDLGVRFSFESEQ